MSQNGEPGEGTTKAHREVTGLQFPNAVAFLDDTLACSATRKKKRLHAVLQDSNSSSSGKPKE